MTRMRLYILSLLILLTSATSFSAFERYYLQSTDYEWMLGTNYSIFISGLEVLKKFDESSGFENLNEVTITNLFSKTSEQNKIVSVKKMFLENEFVRRGWVITFANNLKVGFQSIQGSGIKPRYFSPRLIIGYSFREKDETWFGRDWFSVRTVAPFKALFGLEYYKNRSLQEFRVFGSHVDSSGMVIDVFERHNDNSKINVFPQNPEPLNAYKASDIKDKTIIAVFDSGVDYNHPALASKLVNLGWDFIENDSRPFDHGRSNFFGDKVSHGTAVAAIAAGSGAHTVVLPIRLLGLGEFNADREFGLDFEAAVNFSKKEGARIINMSFGSYISSNADIIKNAKKYGVSDLNTQYLVKSNARMQKFNKQIAEVIKRNPDLLFVVAAGNESEKSSAKLDADEQNQLQQFYASVRLPNILHVASVKKDKTLSSFSVYGKKSIEVAAFGDVSKLPFSEGAAREAAGTSYAAPEVARIAGEVLSINPKLTIEQLRTILKKSVVQTPELEKKLVWGGYLDASLAHQLALQSKRGQ